MTSGSLLRALSLAPLLWVGLDAAPAYAGGSCGGGSDGGSSSSGDSSSDSGGSDYSSYSDDGGSATPACIDDTDVHGFRRCTKFGAWGANMRLPRLFVEVGAGVRQFRSGLGGQRATAVHDTSQFAYRVVMPPTADAAPLDVAATTTLRLGFGVPRGFYSGLEFEAGGLVAPASAGTEMMSAPGTFGSPDIRQRGGLVLGFTGLAGFRAALGPASFAVEGAAGLRSVRYQFESAYHHCVSTTTIASTHEVVEARARAELWLNPWISAGATLGANVLERDDWMAGLFVGFHSRAFAGSR